MRFFLSSGHSEVGVATLFVRRRVLGRALSTGIALALIVQGPLAQDEEPAPVEPEPAEQEPAEQEPAEQEPAEPIEEPEALADSALDTLTEDQEEVEEVVVPEEVPLPVEPSIPIHGFLRARAAGRWTGDERDMDVYGWAAVDVGDPERHRVTAHVNAYVAWDLDDSEDGPFYSIADTRDNGLDSRLYEAYVDVNRVGGIDRLRLGRQQLWATPVFVAFDGAMVETSEQTDKDLQVGAYGGQSVHQFESSPEGDLVAGAYIQARPWKDGRARLDYMRLEDDTNFGDEDNDLWTLGMWQGLREGLDVEGQYSILDSESLDYRVAANAYDVQGNWMFRGAYYELLETKHHLAEEIDPLYNSLLELFPYYQVTMLASGTVAQRWLVQAGYDVRRVDDGDDEGQFNRDFERYHLNSTILDLGRENLDFTLTGEYWDGDGSDVQTWGADVSSPLGKGSEGSLGSYYSLYKYDYFSGNERDHVRTYYIRLEHDLSKDLSVDLDYEYEDNEFDDFQRLRLQVSWRF
jgi:hypothetical protein